MARLHLKLILVAVMGYVCSALNAQANMIVYETLRAKSASGTVYAGHKSEGSQLEDVRVLRCDAKFHACTDVTKTDAAGVYALPVTLASLKVVYLKFLLPNCDELRLTVRVRRGAPKLEVELPLGT